MRAYLAAAEAGDSALAVAVAVLAGVAAVAVAAFTGVLRVPADAAAGRVPRGRPLMPLVGVLFAGVLIWIYVPALYYEVAQGRSAAAPTTAPIAPATPPSPTAAPAPPDAGGAYGLSPREVVAIGAGVPLLAFVVMMIGDALVRPVVGQRLGFGPSWLPWGAAWGALGILLALPLVYCVMVLTTLAYRLIRYEHPSEHELLRTMGDTPDPVVKYLAIVVAVAVAPLWEELLFRGHVQTLIRAGLARVREGARTAERGGGFPVAGAPDGTPPSPAGGGERGGASTLESWLAIGMTSLLFASVHAPWQFPPIFALSLCLGLAYERTGNLWAPIVMHALFNGLMTAFFLGRGAG